MAGSVTSLRSIDTVPEAMLFQPAPFTLSTPEVDLSLPSVFHAHKGTTPSTANRPPEQEANPSSPTFTNQKASFLSPVAILVAESPIRIRIADHQTQLAIATSDQGGIALPDGKIDARLSDAQLYQVLVDRDGLVIRPLA